MKKKVPKDPAKVSKEEKRRQRKKKGRAGGRGWPKASPVHGEKFGNGFSLLSTKGELDEQTLDQVEELLYTADLGPGIVEEVISKLKKRGGRDGEGDEEDPNVFLFGLLKEKMAAVQEKVDPSLLSFKSASHDKLKTVMIVGTNGTGKTTTIGKLALRLGGQGAKVIVGACDTFRAAAVEQLQVWCDRAQVEMVCAREGVRPSGVGFDALKRAQEAKADYCLLDTAGRLHTKGNLMEELKKSKQVLAKLDPLAPQETLLIVDAITGQNALRQAEAFHKALGLSGLILTKCDSSSKAGSAISIVHRMQTPITYIGVGEGPDDLNAFDLDQYLQALLGML